VTDAGATIWGVHAGSRGEAEPLFTKGYVALGWDRVGDLSLLPPAREAFKQTVAEAYPQDKPGSIPVSAGQLYRFAYEMRPADLVVS
jgi:restriction system protein